MKNDIVKEEKVIIEKQLVGVSTDRNGCKVFQYFLKVNGKDFYIKVTSHTQVHAAALYVAVDMNAPKFDDLENQERSEGISFISEDEAIKDLFS